MRKTALLAMLCVAVCLLAACAQPTTPEPTQVQASATPIPTSTSTLTPVPTPTSTPTITSTPAPTPALVENIYWLGSAGFRIEKDLIIYIDPTMLDADAPPADVILITHSHTDHLNQDIVQGILDRDTVIIAGPGAAASPLMADFDVVSLPPGESMTVGEVLIESWPAYYEQFHHPQSMEGVGFLITIDGVTIYYSGDTTYIPELAGLQCDIAILWIPLDDPIGPTKGPAKIATECGAAVVIPHVYLTTSTTDADFVRAVGSFDKAYDGTILILEREQ